MQNNQGFYTIELSLENNLFEQLSQSIHFENITKGRVGNHLVKVEQDKIPLVRTTTTYTIPSHYFLPLHHQIVEKINDIIAENDSNALPKLDFNNALIEIYDKEYATMKYHSDQSLDLKKDSYIGLFTCYEKPEELTAQTLRKLKIKDKITLEEFDIPLKHHSVVLFSLHTNTKFSHKIILEQVPKQKPLTSSNKWLGITFRTSDTYIQFKDGKPYFENGEPLVVANEDQKRDFFRIRGEENRSLDFTYPRLPYTLSIGDTIEPKGALLQQN